VQTQNWPRFLLLGLHRNVSLLAVLFLLIHILTATLDPFASISLSNAVLPFSGSYRPLWLGLGACAFDLLLVIILTSIFRRHLSYQLWRAVHLLAYLCWPVALMHAVGTGSDIRRTWMLAIVYTAIALIFLSVCVRAAIGWPQYLFLRGLALIFTSALVLTFALWLPTGPLAANWAARSGTPASDLPKTIKTTS
jgi:sulfoxide reductase heme-binding subunit YedZ